jgi:3-ketosteroid 9alpha-monooxygenase subunit B
MSYNKLRIAKIVEETPDARSFVLEIPPDLAEKYRYRAGQFLTFRATRAQPSIAYLLSSVPETDGRQRRR